MVWWMQYQVFLPILALQCLQLFWYYLIWRVAYRYVPLVSVPATSHVVHSSFSVLSDTKVAQADVLSDDEDGKED